MNRLLNSCAIALLAIGVSPLLQATQLVNPISAFPITVDGHFSGSGEWSDVKPVAFISTPNQLTRTTTGDPAANSFLYAALAQGAAVTPGSFELYLMYDYLARTIQSYAPGEFVADIKFPIQFPGPNTAITVQVRAGSPGVFNFTVVRDSDSAVISGSLIEGAVGFGPSPETAASHLLIELEVPLLIQPGFSNVLAPNNGVYSPNPATWNASAAKNAGDPPITSAIFQIDPFGDVLISSDLLPSPEPASFALLGFGIAALIAIRRLVY